MNNYKVYANQSLFDVAIQLTGSAENAFNLAQSNGLELSKELAAGDTLVIPKIEKTSELYNFYELNQIKPATALSSGDKDRLNDCEGIGCWAIEIDFKVS